MRDSFFSKSGGEFQDEFQVYYIFNYLYHKILRYLHPMMVKVSSLKHHPKNKEIYTLSSIEELMESISEVGLLQPLIIDSRN